MQAQSPWRRLNSSRPILLGGVTGLLLLPVPLFAAYTLGSWSVTQPAGHVWSATSGSSNFDLIITPQNGTAGASPVQIDFTAPVTFTSHPPNTGSATTLGFDAIRNITPFPSNSTTAGLTVTIGFLKSNGTIDTTIFQNSNQFTGNLPSILDANPPTVTVDNNAHRALVRFVFTGIVSWQAVPGSQIHVTFSSSP